jgi:biopolymer transport protein ExbB/TolQ
MNLTQVIVDFALLGAEWVLWLLVALSVLSVGVMIERGLFLRQRRVDHDELEKALVAAMRKQDPNALDKRYKHNDALQVRVALAGLEAGRDGVDAAAEAMNAEKARVRQTYEAHLVVLGTLGNNAPFIGLFGTVLGIVAALHDLALNPQGGAEAVMASLSEALVVTAVGLLVALPAVIAFNLFNRRVRAVAADADTIAHVVLAELHGAARRDATAGGA